MALSPVPDPEPPPSRQLPLFEALRPARFEMTLAGTMELELWDEAQADLAEGLKLGTPFLITISRETTGEQGPTFYATVSKRTHKRVKNGDIVSVAVLTIAAEE